MQIASPVRRASQLSMSLARPTSFVDGDVVVYATTDADACALHRTLTAHGETSRVGVDRRTVLVTVR